MRDLKYKVALSATSRPISKHNQPSTAREAKDKIIRDGKHGYNVYVWSMHLGKYIKYD